MPNLSNHKIVEYGRRVATSVSKSPYSREITSTSQTTDDVVSYTEVKSRSSLTTPGWNSANRPTPSTNPFHFDCEIKKYASGSLRRISKADRSSPITETTWTGVFDWLPIANGTLITTEEIAAANRVLTNGLLARVKDQKVNLLQMYAERNQTVNLFSSTVKKLASAAGNLKRGNLVGAAKALGVSPRASAATRKSVAKNASQHWLELQYGWKPLLGDIYGCAEAVADAQTEKERSKAVSKTNLESSDTTIVDNSAAGYQSVIQKVDKVSLNAGAYFSSENQFTESLADMGITNPAMIAWELLPWSFVVDWVYPIGGFISNFDATQGLAFSGGWSTSFRETTVTETRTYYETASNWQSGIQIASRKLIVCDRSKMDSFPSNSLPAFKNPFSWTHVANAMALLSTNFRK